MNIRARISDFLKFNALCARVISNVSVLLVKLEMFISSIIILFPLTFSTACSKKKSDISQPINVNENISSKSI